MKHLKRSDCRTQTRKEIMAHYCDGSAPEVVEVQINQAWKRKEEEETARIKKEIDISWEEYNAVFDNEDNSIVEIAEYFQTLDDNITETEGTEPLYQKDKKKSVRRRATARAKKRLFIKAESAMKNLKKREEEDSRNHNRHASEGFKSQAARAIALKKRAKKLQR